MQSNTSTRLQKLGIDRDEILSALALKAEPYTIFLSGSIIEGYGNADSDLDVFVIYPGEVPAVNVDFDLGAGLISMEYTTNWRLDVENWFKEQALLVAQRFHQYSPENWNQSLAINESDIDFAHKLRTGVPIQQHEHFQQLYQAFDFGKVSRAIMMKKLIIYTGVQEDAAGAITSKQYGTALLTARAAVQLAIDALIAAHGETNSKNKWRFFNLEKLGDPALLERYWELETPRINSRDDVLDYARQCITFASQIVMKAQKARS